MQPVVIAPWDQLEDRVPAPALVGRVDLVIVRHDAEVSVLYGRCLHRGALMADGTVEGDNLVCGLHGWDYAFTTGISAYDRAQRLHRFRAWVEGGQVLVDAEEVAAWELDNPQPSDRTAYQGVWQDPHGTPEEPHVGTIRALAADGLAKVGHHGPVAAMGVPRDQLPRCDSRSRARPAPSARRDHSRRGHPRH